MPTNTRLKMREWLEQEGLTLDEALTEYGHESVMPALCTEGCEVEPDGRCEHGNPSLLMGLGLI